MKINVLYRFNGFIAEKHLGVVDRKAIHYRPKHGNPYIMVSYAGKKRKVFMLGNGYPVDMRGACINIKL